MLTKLTPLALLLAASTLLLVPVWAQLPAPIVLTSATAPASMRAALATADSALADPMHEAQRTLPQMKKRYLAGLASGDQFTLTVRVLATDTSFRQVAARVLGWHGNMVQALLPTLAGATEPIPVSFPENAVLDWTLVRAGGREEGNFVGRYLEIDQRVGGLQLR